MNIYDGALSLIGKTPLIELKRFAEKRNLFGRIFAKVEFFNVGGSVKDRAALFMIEDAEKRGLLKKGGTVVEATSGNTGIGLAVVCAVKGYKLVLTMPSTASVERVKLALKYGAEVILTDGASGMKGAVDKAKRVAEERGGYIVNQFCNTANVRAHESTTAKEILADTDGKVDYFVSAFGSGGTITGVGRVLKNYNEKVKIIGVEPSASPLASKGYSGKHSIQGIGANFLPDIMDLELIDEIITVNDKEAFDYSDMLARVEGLLCGISSGAALKGAEIIAKDVKNVDKNIVVILPDTGERYLSKT